MYNHENLIIAPTVVNFSPSCLLIFLQPIPALCRSTILSLMSLDSSFVLTMVETLECDWLCGQVTFIQLHNDVKSWQVFWVMNWDWVLINGELTGLWDPELLLVGRGSNTYFMQKYDNTFIKCIWWCYSGFFLWYSVSQCKKCSYD